MEKQLTVPWAALGSPVTGSATVAEAMDVAGLNWGVEHCAAGARLPRAGGGAWKKVSHLQAVVRTDTWQPLGIVGDIHTLVPNLTAFTPFDVLMDTNDVELVHAAEVKEGRQVFLVARLTEGYEIGGDRHETILISRNQHDGRGGLSLSVRQLRLACANQLPGIAHRLRKGYQVGKAVDTWHLRHTTTVEKRMEEAYRQLDYTLKAQQAFREAAEALVMRPFTLDDMQAFATALYPSEGTKIPSRTAKRNEERQAELVAVWEGSANLENIRATAYGGLNAVAEWADHHFAFRGTRRASVEENRFLSTSDSQGTAYQLKAKAAQLILSSTN